MFGLLLLTCVFAGSLWAQDERPIDRPSQDVHKPPPSPKDVRGNVLRQLGLSREQMQQMRRINQDRKPLMDAAHRRLREANRALDEAIYADQVDAAGFQARLREHHLAQTEVARIRFTHEFAVRSILTPEQLSRFRDFRQRFDQARQVLDRRRGTADRPLNRPVRNNNPAQFQPKQPPVRGDQRKRNF